MSDVDPIQAQRTNRILWITLLVSQLIYVGVALSGAVQVRTQPVDIPILPVALGIVAVATGAGSHFCWRRATGAGLSLHAPRPQPADAFTYYIVGWVFDESIAIYGLVLAVMAFPVGIWSLFSLPAFVLLLLHRPTDGGADPR